MASLLIDLDLLVRERWLRSAPSRGMLFITRHYLDTIFSLAQLCVSMVMEVETYDPFRMVRVLAVAHIWRLMQCTIGQNKAPPLYYLRQVLPFYDLPITAVIAAFHSTVPTLVKSPEAVLLLVTCASLNILILFSEITEREGDISFTEASSSNSEWISQRSYDDANSSIPSVTNLIQWQTGDAIHSQVADPFAAILLPALCVDFLVRVESLNGTHELFYMVMMLASINLPRPMPLHMQGKFKVSHAYYLRNVLLSYDLPITASITVFYSTVRTFSKTLLQSLSMELILLALIHSLIKAKELELNTMASLASSLKTDLVHQAPNSISRITDFSKWEKGKMIGSGGYGTVYLAHHREIRAVCAIKELRDSHKLENVESIKKEIKILSRLRHPNIVQYYDHKIDERGISLYMEYIEPGSLKKYIPKGHGLRETLVRDFTGQILLGLVYLHRNRVAHRDLKPDNLLVDSNNIVKLVDFGLAKHLAESVGKHSVMGTLYYAAPEVLQKKEYKCSREAYAADIWSLGCVIIEMFSGKHPWSGFEPVQAFYNVSFKQQHPPIPENLCQDGKHFLKICFARTPAERPSAAALLDHPFLKAQTT